MLNVGMEITKKACSLFVLVLSYLHKVITSIQLKKYNIMLNVELKIALLLTKHHYFYLIVT